MEGGSDMPPPPKEGDPTASDHQPSQKRRKKELPATTAYNVSDLIDHVQELGFESLKVDKELKHGQVRVLFLCFLLLKREWGLMGICCFFFIMCQRQVSLFLKLFLISFRHGTVYVSIATYFKRKVVTLLI
jgi:hypothetical protein